MVESSGDEDSLGEDASKQGRKINDIDADDDITLVSVHRENDEVNVVEEVVEVINTANLIIDDAQVSTAGGQVSVAGDIVSTASIPKKGIVIQDLGESTTTISSQQPHGKGKGKEILIEEPEPVKFKKRRDQIRLDEEVAAKLQAEFDKEERLAREKSEKEEEANIALIEIWDDI
ncbi:hypothetical protein Tco_1228375 [Tanacetum coccineum]